MRPARLAVALLAAVLLLPATASAFPGRNGPLVVERATGTQRVELRASTRQELAAPVRAATPAVSAAGVRVAFTGKGAIWVMQANGAMPRQIAFGYKVTSPTWSPLGDQVAYAGGPSGGHNLYLAAVDGDGSRVLSGGSGDDVSPAWSIRNRIAFVRVSDRGDGDLRWLPPTGGKPKRLTAGKADDRDPAWSPDGRRLAFTRSSPKHRDVFIADQRGHHLRRVRRLPRPARSPVFSPDGRSIAFVMASGKRRGVYTMRTNGSHLKRVVKGKVRSVDWSVAPGDPVIAAAGDIACDVSDPNYDDGYGSGTHCQARATSDLMLRMDLSAVLMLGDAHQFSSATYPQFLQSYDPTWGRLKPITHPTVGNHEYTTPGATGYFDYFDGVGASNGPAGGRGQGWHSFDVGAWHLIALNANCSQVGCTPGSPQERWLRADLAAHPARCTLAFMHQPRLSSGAGEGTTPAVQPLWQALYDGGADLVLSGHDHAYERFAPLDAAGRVDPRGMREIISGTGGKSHEGAGAIQPGSEVRNSTSYGVTRLALHPTSYDWQFVPTESGGFTDAGSSNCH